MSDPEQWGDTWWIHTQMPHTEKATEMACKDMLMMLLAIAPNGVQLAPGSFHTSSLPRIRNLAVSLWCAVGWHHLSQLATDAMAGRLPSAPRVTDHSSSKACPALVLVPQETDADQEAQCIVALQPLHRGKEHYLTALPHQVWAVLAENVPPPAA